MQKVRSVAEFISILGKRCRLVDEMYKTSYGIRTPQIQLEVSTLLKNSAKLDSEAFHLYLRNTINRQCADAVKNIRTTYKYSKTYRDAEYSNFCRELGAYETYYNAETRELVQNCLERVRYEYNGANQTLPFHNDAADYERSLLTKKLRYEILQRDKFRCTICGRGQEDGVKLHVDHIKPVSKGGRTIPENLRTLCQDCNLGKRDRYDEDGLN